MGTRATAAPEQYGYAQTDQRTDLYAVGMTLIWLFTGQYDREGLTQTEGCSHRFRKILEKSVAFAPEDRYQKAEDFSDALAGRTAKTRFRYAALAAAAVLILLAGIWGISSSGTDATLPSDEETGTPLSTEQVVFTSSSMEAAVRQALARPEGDITYDELSQIKRLAVVGTTPFSEEQTFDYRISCYVDNQYQAELPMGDITDQDMSLLSYMPQLDTLYLCRQKIRDISVLENLPLTTLALCENEILDLTPLAGLEGLQTLYLGGNPATDYSALSGLKRLETLIVEGSSTRGLTVADSLSFLDGLKLRMLGLGFTVPKDGNWEPLTRQIALEKLQLWDPGEDAVAAAATLVDLKIISIGDYYADDLTALSTLSGLEALILHKGSIRELTGVESLGRLLSITVGYNAVSDLSPLIGLNHLNYVQLENLSIEDYSPLMQLPALGYVIVSQAEAPQVEADCPGYTFELQTY